MGIENYTGITNDRSLLKHLCLSKQVCQLLNPTLEFQILLLANGKCFLLIHCQKMDAQSSFTVLRHLYHFDFPIIISKPWILNCILTEG